MMRKITFKIPTEKRVYKLPEPFSLKIPSKLGVVV
jgi:hypothetical protein